MSIEKKLAQRRSRRVARVRVKTRNASYPRVSIFRSSTHIYAQLIDDSRHTTLASCSSLQLPSLTGDKKDKAKAVGLELAKRILACGVTHVVFDRGPYLFHGRVQQVAQGLKEGGINL